MKVKVCDDSATGIFVDTFSSIYKVTQADILIRKIGQSATCGNFHSNKHNMSFTHTHTDADRVHTSNPCFPAATPTRFWLMLLMIWCRQKRLIH